MKLLALKKIELLPVGHRHFAPLEGRGVGPLHHLVGSGKQGHDYKLISFSEEKYKIFISFLTAETFTYQLDLKP